MTTLQKHQAWLDTNPTIAELIAYSAKVFKAAYSAIDRIQSACKRIVTQRRLSEQYTCKPRIASPVYPVSYNLNDIGTRAHERSLNEWYLWLNGEIGNMYGVGELIAEIEAELGQEQALEEALEILSKTK
ncbi:MAG: hypothetical protein ABIN91_10965 [Mucilaginibacter sp.]|uniref:hypothetical protein n=1 Tax=Mucilaginibacter sp. TaxID=1882438 RepID=UPI003266533B